MCCVVCVHCQYRLARAAVWLAHREIRAEGRGLSLAALLRVTVVVACGASAECTDFTVIYVDAVAEAVANVWFVMALDCSTVEWDGYARGMLEDLKERAVISGGGVRAVDVIIAVVMPLLEL